MNKHTALTISAGVTAFCAVVIGGAVNGAGQTQAVVATDTAPAAAEVASANVSVSYVQPAAAVAVPTQSTVATATPKQTAATPVARSKSSR